MTDLDVSNNLILKQQYQNHTGQCKRTGGCYNELVVAFFITGGGVKGKKIYTCWLYYLFINLHLFYLWWHLAHRPPVTLHCNSYLNLLCPMGRLLELSSLCSGLQYLFWFQYKKHKVYLTKIPTHGMFKLLSVIYFDNMCTVTCDF